MPQSQAAAFPRNQEVEETDKTKQAQIKKKNVRKTLRLALSSPSEVIPMLKGLENKNKITPGKVKTNRLVE